MAVAGAGATSAATPVAVLSVTRATVAASVARAAFVRAGLPVTVTVPGRAGVIRLRVLTIPRAGAAAAGKSPSRVLYRVVHRVKVTGTDHRVRFRLRSRKLYAGVRPGGRYALEITPGVSAKTLGKPMQIRFRVR